MSSSTYIPSVAVASGKLSQSWHGNGRRIPFWADDGVGSFMGGAGGVITNAADMAKWLSVWLNEGVDMVSGETIMPQGVYDELTTAHTIVDGRPSAVYDSLIGYGMGWERWAAGGVDVCTSFSFSIFVPGSLTAIRACQIVHHTGGVPGFSSLVSFSPSHKLGVVALVNMSGALSIIKILRKTLDDVLGTQLSQTAHSFGEGER